MNSPSCVLDGAGTSYGKNTDICISMKGNMRIISMGGKLGGFQVRRLISKQPGREEYGADPVAGNHEGEYRVVAFDTRELPDDSTCRDGEAVVPLEQYILERQPLRAFPKIVERGEDDSLKWMVLKYQRGITVRDYLGKMKPFPLEEALRMTINLCSSIEALACFDKGKVGHFNITPDTVRIVGEGDSRHLFLSGFGYVSMEGDDRPFTRAIDESSYYLAPELFVGRRSVRADVYGTCLILYMLLTGRAYPWDRGLLSPYDKVTGGECSRDAFVAGMGRLWNSTPDLSDVHPGRMKAIIYGGISTNPVRRTESIVELKEELERVLWTETRSREAAGDSSPGKTSLGGFTAVAGMTELKREMMRKFILPVRQRKLAKAYRITPPNGSLLYGPPGCGKTFVVERIAEEAGLPCRVFRPSDVASIYVHGGQERIKSLFDDVRKHAPIIVCFDEADAFVPGRSRPGNEHYAGEVNEFLTQLNNAAKDGVYVFLMTNNPALLDPAVLRTGRVDEKFYIPMPDTAAREEFFRIRFRDIPSSGGMDYAVMAALTDGMTFSDLDYVVTEACRVVFLEAVELNTDRVLPVTQAVVEEVIASAPRSVTGEDIRQYEALREEFSERVQGVGRKKIGFG